MSELTFKIIECPRDAMQGRKDFIPTDKKIDYLNRLLTVGFEAIDCGSFVSPKAIPQMADTKEVLDNIDKTNSKSKLSVVVANKSGAIKAAEHEKVDIIGFPFSISENFQQFNTNKSREEAFEMVKEINQIANDNGKHMLIYLSMAFGNPYGETWNEEIVKEWSKKMADIGISSINLSDTIGVADEKTIVDLFQNLIPHYPEIEFGAHFHTVYTEWHSKVQAAYDNGCRRFDGAIKGLGGCPMSKSDMVGNMPTEKLISFANEHKEKHGLNLFDFESAWNVSLRTFGLV
ncbi:MULTISPECIES: hydroxymethylglutaryl-CoA lyase [Empedobacter]|jgi:hydroxymethylglutaryl-CoA lyase|uniref:Hydroxymethylglutaryl-CoA lyase n=3 Tax=Empedobacter TaxID=59734 RepID=A0A376GDB6_9FLAO|nr:MULTISPECIES: hydroxymethylglutaryl-CoA lyase [Empedobacter]HAD80390.1 hydroxymethylglutaryl-CoA lyase [Flavobacteriaceae bacterium]MBW1618733.1 hydroxymethylglutaryl-CoA lyase [Empedobacter falsenii]MDH1603208.1 hydroxymethylglutaryl-CoA lyase [Empedobacter sp. GD03739]MDH1881258.1 hydroxymethylglutaryl-CoA lyase [Empedobacter sp. GD03797]MDH2206762.1 hydroxymethylglutaryl-CoA lyase [Empedobacter sp. GD03644]